MSKLAVVFGGSGFLGTQVVRELCRAGWRVRVACRRPHQSPELRVEGRVGQVQLAQVNVRAPLSLARAMDGADAVINLVGILYEKGRQKFDSVHAQGAGNLAKAAAQAGVSQFIQVSAIGANADSASKYARSKAKGERQVKAAFSDAVILRPSVIFGEGDGLYERFAGMSLFTPVLPLPGASMQVQPVYVGDVAQAIMGALNTADAKGHTYELAGPEVFTMRQIMQQVLDFIDRKRIVIALPGFVATGMGFVGEVMGALPLVEPFLTRDQLLLMKTDNVASGDLPGLADLGVDEPETVYAIVPEYLERFRRYGEFHEASPV